MRCLAAIRDQRGNGPPLWAPPSPYSLLFFHFHLFFHFPSPSLLLPSHQQHRFNNHFLTPSFDPSPLNAPSPSPIVQPFPSTELPQCTDNLLLKSETRLERVEEGESGGREASGINVTSFVQLTTITLGETLCMLIRGNKSLLKEGNLGDTQYNAEDDQPSMMHTLEYVGLELHYGITGAYKFALPTIIPRCKCDCAGGETICSVEKYQYRNCSITGGVCYRTHIGGQSNAGCLSSGKADICCQVEIRPYKDWTFQAIRLKQPSMASIVRYRIFEQSTGRGKEGQWAQSADMRIAIPLNKGATKFELNESNEEERGGGQYRVEISAAGSRPQRQMEPGMYFYKIEGGTELADSEPAVPQQLREGVALNSPVESSLEKLGWFRWERGKGWTVRKGLEKVTQAQHISVEDCKAQRYRAAFNAEQFVLRGHIENSSEMKPAKGEGIPAEVSSGDEVPIEGMDEIENFDLGTAVEEEPWVGAVRMGEREVVLEHAEGIALTLTLRTESRPRIVHHRSKFSEFSGAIILDKESNLYLNLTFLNARGTLIGQIFSSADSLSVMESIFSVDIGQRTLRKCQRVVATSVRSARLVCFYPMGSMEERKCHRLDFFRHPLQEIPPSADQWKKGQSECRGCNERGVESFLASMDPRQWLNGLNSPAELFTCLVELVLCVVLLLLAVLLFTKCVFPLCQCVRFVLKPAKSGAKKNQNGRK